MSALHSHDRSAIYHQYRWEQEKPLDRVWRVLRHRVRENLRRDGRRFEQLSMRLAAFEPAMLDLSEARLVDAVWSSRSALRSALQHRDSSDEALCHALAAVREVTRRESGLRLHDVQLLGALCMLMGSIAEMQTGEGKSLTAVPVAVIAAVAGFPIHVITVNEYLASRDADQFRSVYTRFRLEVGLIRADMAHGEKSREYRKSVVYCTNKDLAFDHMRDRIGRDHFNRRGQYLLGKLNADTVQGTPTLLPGLYFALVDEADSVLLDEAGTPLVIARESDLKLEEDVFRTSMSFARNFVHGQHFHLDPRSGLLRWTDEGRVALETISEHHGGIWSGPRRAREWVEKALRALHSYQRGRDYIVDDDEVQIVDPNTGRRMPDRQWEGGIHQLVQVKEGLAVTPRRETLAKTTYQRFFRRYWRIAGMSGTINEVREEVFSTYGVGVRTVPTHRESARRSLPSLVFASRSAAVAALRDVVLKVHGRGQPVLIGTQSVLDSEDVSSVLTSAGLSHRVLNALNDAEEATIVAAAGRCGAITVATNMAGRGTDISLDEMSRDAGGLHVLAFGMSHSRRVDRQLCGRCARQGDPGSYQLFASLDEELLQKHESWLCKIVKRLMGDRGHVSGLVATMLLRSVQRRIERRHHSNRAALLTSEDRLLGSLGFTGVSE